MMPSFICLLKRDVLHSCVLHFLFARVMMGFKLLKKFFPATYARLAEEMRDILAPPVFEARLLHHFQLIT
jgi:hypothetical protein